VLHQTAVALDISAENCAQFAFGAFFNQWGITSLNKKASEGIEKSLRGFTFVNFC
jgi:hypothetical protein